MIRFLTLLIAVTVAGTLSAQQAAPPPERPFTLLLITQTGGYQSEVFDQYYPRAPVESTVRSWVFRPQSAPMKRWQMWATPKELAVDSPIVKEHHADILRDAQQFPAIALVDSTNGSRWHLMSGESLPQNELELASQLDIYYAATMEAAKQAVPNAVQTVSPARLDLMRAGTVAGVSRGPRPYTPRPGGLFNPQVDVDVQVPDMFDLSTQVDGRVDPDTRRWITWIGVGVGIVVLIVAAAIVIAAWMISEAITEDDKTPA